MLEGVVVIGFGVWALATVLVQVPSLTDVVRRYDLLAMVPEWRFFAPNPARGDYHLLFRDFLDADCCTMWTEVPVGGTRRWWNVFWNTSKRANKALFDAVTELARDVREQDEVLEGCVSYLTLLTYVSALPRTLPVQSTQFLVMYAGVEDPDREPDVFYVSGVHSL